MNQQNVLDRIKSIVMFCRGCVCAVIGHKWYNPPWFYNWLTGEPFNENAMCERCGKIAQIPLHRRSRRHVGTVAVNS